MHAREFNHLSLVSSVGVLLDVIACSSTYYIAIKYED